jgi:hypothetical protein
MPKEFRGVVYDKRAKNKYGARMVVGGRAVYLGYTATAREAALLYDAAAVYVHGDKAKRNLPNEPLPTLYDRVLYLLKPERGTAIASPSKAATQPSSVRSATVELSEEEQFLKDEGYAKSARERILRAFRDKSQRPFLRELSAGLRKLQDYLDNKAYEEASLTR